MPFLNTNGFTLPVYIAKGVYTQGHVADIGPLQVAIVDKKTQHVATASGNGKEFFLVGGSPHTRDSVAKFYKGMQWRKESEPFLGKDVEYFEKVAPSRADNEAWVIGYDGSSTSKTLKFEADKVYKLKVRLYGDKVFRNSLSSLEKIIPLYTGCSNVDDCDGSCGPEYVGVKKQTIAWAKAIMSNPELSEYKLKVTPLFSDYAATAASANDYTLSVSDDGSGNALQDVQRFYGDKTITRKSYYRGTSVYEVKARTDAPEDYTSKSYSVPVVNCDECLAGDFTEGSYTYIVNRPVAADEDLNDDTARDAYADGIATEYGGSGAVYLGLDKGNAVVKFSSANAETALGSDILEQIAYSAPYCTTPAGETTAWVEGAGSYTVTRTLKATFANQDCDEVVTVDELESHFARLKNPVVVTDVTGSDKCTKTFQVVQTSYPMVDEYCQGKDIPKFEDVPSYKGATFIENDVAETYDASIKAGLRFDAPFYSETFGDCSYDVNERWDNKPLRMEISILDDELNLCKFSEYAHARQVKQPKYERLSGKYVRREYIQRNSAYFQYEKWNASPRDRELLDNNVLSQIRDDVFYVMYQLGYQESRDQHNFNQKKQHFAPIIFVEEGDLETQVALENHIQGVTSKFGVHLRNRIPVK